MSDTAYTPEPDTYEQHVAAEQDALDKRERVERHNDWTFTQRQRFEQSCKPDNDDNSFGL